MPGMPWEDFQPQEETNSPKGYTIPEALSEKDLESDRVLSGVVKGGQQWVKSETPEQAAEGPWNDFKAQPAESKDNLEEFWDTLKNPLQAVKEDSMVAHAINAYNKGTFDKPISELIKDVKEGVGDISAEKIWDTASQHPGKFGAEFLNAIMADPYLLFAPMGLGGKVASALSKVGKVGKVVGTALETGVAAGAMQVPISAAQQLDKQGYINPNQLAQEVGVTAAGGAALGGILSLASRAKGKIATGDTPQDLAATTQFNMSEGDDIMTAINKAMETHGVPEDKAQALSDIFKQTVETNPGLETDFAKMREELKPLLPETPIQTPEGSTKTFAQMTKDLVNEQKRVTTGTQDFEALMNSLGSLEAKKLAEATSIQELTPRAALEQVEQLPKAEQAQATQGALIGSAEGALKKPEIDRTIDDLFAIDNVKSMGEGDYKIPELTPAFKQRGVMDPELVKYMGLGLGGAAIGGWWADDKAKGALIGGALALGGPIALKAGKSIVDQLKGSYGDPLESMFSKSSTEWKAAEKAWDKKVTSEDPAEMIFGSDKEWAKAQDKWEGSLPKDGTHIPKDGNDVVEFHSGGEPLPKAAKDYYNSLKRDKAIAKHVDDLLSSHEGIIAGTGLSSDRLAHAIKQLVPDEARRGTLIHAIQEGRVPELQGKERVAAELFQKEMAEAGDFAQKAGILDDIINDGTYVTQLWKDGPKAQNYYSSVSPTSRFAEDRLIPSYKEGMALGLEPKTLDLAEIARIYGKSIGKTIANKRLLGELKDGNLPNGEPLMAPVGKAPIDYIQINHPQLRDMRVHPELAPSLSHVFYSNNIPAYVQAMTAVSSVAKRGIFSFSGFHIKSLLDVATGLAVGTANPKVLSKIPSMYKMIKEGKAGDFADEMIQAGLKVDPHSGIDMDNDVFKNLINTTEAAIKSLPGGKLAALPITAVKKLDQGMQWLLWDYLHPAMKMSTAGAMYERELLKQSKLLNMDPGAKVKSPVELQREIATTVNDLFGGLNWRQVSNDVETKFLHDITASLTNPEGLRATRIALLAPDWTVATARAGYKGLKATAKTFIPGVEISASDDIYRRYFLGSSMLYATIADALNVKFSGHHFWENEDPTSVDMGNGQRLQLSKHFMEPFHWLQHPGKATISKIGYVPKEALSQAMGKEFITAGGGPEMADPSLTGRVKHAAKGMLPITTQAPSPEAAALGLIGLPIYGKTKEEKRQEAKERVEKRKAKERDPEERRKKRIEERKRKRERD